MHRRVLPGVLLLTAASAWAQAPVPAGPEFRANAFTTSDQNAPVVAMDPSGNFVVVWTSYTQDGSGNGVFGRRFDVGGAPRGAEFRVNTTTLGHQTYPAVAMDAGGNFIVVWAGQSDGSTTGVFAQLFDAAGTPRGGEFLVNTFTLDTQEYPRVAADPAGNFVVAWHSDGQDGEFYGVFAQRYDAAGTPLGGEFQVNTYTTDDQSYATVAADADGDFIVAWGSRIQDGSGFGAFAQRYDATGAPRGAEFRVNSVTTGPQSYPSAAFFPDGAMVVAWEGVDDGGFGVFAKRYDALGAQQGGEFRVNTYTTSYQRYPIVAASGGGFVVVWSSFGAQDGSQGGVFAQRYDSAGTPRGSEFRVNSYTTNFQEQPVVAADAVGNFTVSWTSATQDGSFAGTFAQRFGGLHPRLLVVDPVSAGGSDGNGVLEPGESAPVRPSWQNSVGSTQNVGADARNFSGPAGATYTITDGVAAYQLPTGATLPCTDCFALGVSNPATRPAVHWDASFREVVLPEAVHGQTKPWTLHVGGSFSDVSRSNPFYGFIETLLHHGVTGGCAAGQYCPGSSATRREMAVFVLTADEGTSFAPPACVGGGELFTDVPASSGFCPWIEELSRRGVVSGCNASPPQYCPTAAVTRAQMAVFVLATKEPGVTPPDCVAGSEIFGDVPAANGFCRWIEELSRRGIVSGCQASPALYCPSSPVTRAQMGVFISGTFGLTLYGP